MNSDQPSSISRRDFLSETLRLGAGAVITATVFPGFAGALQTEKPLVLATIRISEYKTLNNVGGWLLIQDTPSGDVLIVRSSEKQFSAMSNICPHKECKVKVKNEEMIQCPCHRSAYQLDGTYITGPSRKSLTRFTLVEKDGVLTVLEG